jgi:hypothetical protein
MLPTATAASVKTRRTGRCNPCVRAGPAHPFHTREISAPAPLDRHCELPDSVDNPKPDRHTGEVAISREFLGSFGTFRPRLIAEAGERQVGDPPDVDLGYHAGRLPSRTSIDG